METCYLKKKKKTKPGSFHQSVLDDPVPNAGVE